MANEIDVKVEDIEDTDDNIADIEDTETTDWKAEAQKANQELKKQAGIAKRNATRLKKLREQKSTETKQEEKKNEPDYAKLAYLEAKGITSDEDIAWAEKQAKDSGKSFRELFGAKWFQEELKERREEVASKEAIPSGSKRSANATRDDVDYWLAKGENPSDPILARKVVKARIERERQKNTFTDNPVV